MLLNHARNMLNNAGHMFKHASNIQASNMLKYVIMLNHASDIQASNMLKYVIMLNHASDIQASNMLKYVVKSCYKHAK